MNVGGAQSPEECTLEQGQEQERLMDGTPKLVTNTVVVDEEWFWGSLFSNTISFVKTIFVFPASPHHFLLLNLLLLRMKLHELKTRGINSSELKAELQNLTPHLVLFAQTH